MVWAEESLVLVVREYEFVVASEQGVTIESFAKLVLDHEQLEVLVEAIAVTSTPVVNLTMP